MPQKAIKICAVCGDKAVAFNFNGLTCACCKIFFRRNANNKKLKCRLEGNCPIDFCSRKSCPACRFAKCVSIGMQLPAKWKHSLNQLPDNAKTISETSQSDPGSENGESQLSFQLSPLESQQIEQLNQKLSIFAKESALPIVGEMEDINFGFSLQGLYAKKIVKLCKTFEQFRTLPQAEQYTILKEFYFEFCTVRFALAIDTARDCTKMISDESGTQVYTLAYQKLEKTPIAGTLKEYRNLSYTLYYALEDDLTIANLLVGQFLFSKRDQSESPVSCQDLHTLYRRLLLRYLESKYGNTTQAQCRYTFLFEALSRANLQQMRDNLIAVLGNLQLNSNGEILKEVFNL